MKYSIKQLIKKFNIIMDETPLPFDSRSAKDYRTMGKDFRDRIKVDEDEKNQTLQEINGISKNDFCKGAQKENDIVLK